MIDVSSFIQGVEGESRADDLRSASGPGLGPVSGPRVVIDAENAAAGLGRLAVAIVNLLHELLERQAIRRMDNGTLTEQQVENLGECLMRQSQAIDELCVAFGISRNDLSLDLGPLGKLV
jgi:hypothetical protein